MTNEDRFKPFIGGKFIDGTGGTRKIRSPWDLHVTGIVELASPEDIEAAIASSAAAKGPLARAPAWRRAQWLEEILAGIRRHEDALVRTIVAEGGKPIKLASLEVRRAIDTFSFAAEEARRIGGEVIALDAVPAGEGRIGITRRFPAGAVAAITPFNFPLNLVAHKVAPAIAAGCPTVLKPADQTPLTALLLARIVSDSGAPAGTLDVVPCDIAHAGPLIEDDRLRVLSFTGSAEVGWALRARAGKKRVLLELGGNAAAIIHEDADLAHAAEKCSLGAFSHAGQVCISVQRILVHEKIAERFIDLLLSKTRDLACGNPSDPNVVVGPMRADADADRVMSWIEEARTNGANVLCGGTREGRMVAPTILGDVDSDLPIWREEAFGPVAIVATYRDAEEAFQRTNSSSYGLQAGIFTNDMSVLMQAFHCLDVGAVIHDDAPTFRTDHMPYGGVKASGIGREGVRYAIEEFTEPRLLACVCHDKP